MKENKIKNIKFWFDFVFEMSNNIFKVFIVVFVIHYSSTIIGGSAFVLGVIAITGLLYAFRYPYITLRNLFEGDSR